tara:strand:- start:445 stop:624 length:180 start_codon:yes stop_codon:yes gene_type:complete
MSEFVEEAKENLSKASSIVEGIASGLLIMVVPMLAIGVAVGIGLFVLRTPAKLLDGVVQ